MRVGTDCSGIETPLMALEGLAEFDHVFSSEVDDVTRETLLANRAPRHMYSDIRKRSMPPRVDLYICGFPCQSFSSAGLRAGEGDTRGQIFQHVSNYIQTKKPKMFLLENVANLLSIDGGRCWQTIQEGLHGYTLHHKVLNTKDYGLPQSRRRVYIVGFREDVACAGLFGFPKPQPLIFTLADVFHGIDREPCVPTNRERANIKIILNKMKKKQVDMRKPVLMDVSGSAGWLRAPSEGISPCLKTQCLRLLWYFKRRGKVFISRLTVGDARQLQGIPDTFVQTTSDANYAKQIGNAMSVPVVQLILKNMLAVFKTNKADKIAVLHLTKQRIDEDPEAVGEWMEHAYGRVFVEDLQRAPMMSTETDSNSDSDSGCGKPKDKLNQFYKDVKNKKEIKQLLASWEVHKMDFEELEAKVDMILEENPRVDHLDTVLYRMLAFVLKKK